MNRENGKRKKKKPGSNDETRSVHSIKEEIAKERGVSSINADFDVRPWVSTRTRKCSG
jgi:hypothetical protein